MMKIMSKNLVIFSIKLKVKIPNANGYEALITSNNQLSDDLSITVSKLALNEANLLQSTQFNAVSMEQSLIKNIRSLLRTKTCA